MSPSSKMNELAAVVDIGTNTFHLLIARWAEGKLEEVYRERHFVKLAEEGIEFIGQASIARAVVAIHNIGAAIKRHPVTACAAFATAALRTAANGPALHQVLQEALGQRIQLINGKREAQLIAQGVAAAQPPTDDYLVMDIGGGSVEYILVRDGKAGFSESYPIGAQVLRRHFHQKEPFGKTSQDALDSYLEQQLQPVLDAVRASGQPLVLIGASGTFDELGEVYGQPLSEQLQEVEATRVSELFEEASSMTAVERSQDERIPAERADMIVVALGLIEFWVKRFPQLRLLTCDYALKEGALIGLLNEPSPNG